ncbi:DoxX family protein [Paenibacillus solisilvae]|uniref:DoxX family protein n=1 Tax=Paenibacillus solisilvae TaxID=2486751 RepID=A0ABW0VWA9_9BACL
MFLKFLKENVYASYVLTVLRLYVGWKWLDAGWGKTTQGNFDATGFLKGALSKATGENPAVQSWWAGFLKGFAIPNNDLFNILIPWGELFVGLGLIFGTFTTLAALMGAVMNFSYMFSGSISTNPQMVLVEVLILVAGFNAAKIGLDRWLIPYITNRFTPKKDQRESSLQSSAP